MISGRVKETKLKEGTLLREALAAACENSLPHSFSLKQLNQLLDHAAQSKDARDPLELKHTLASMGEALGRLTLKQRKRVRRAHPAAAAPR